MSQDPIRQSGQELFKPTSLYVCANRLKVPQVGSVEADFRSKPDVVVSLEKPVLLTPSLPADVSDHYLKTISADLLFTEDVIKDRCFHTLPYDGKYLKEAFDISEIVPFPPKTKFTMVRYNQRGSDTRHPPCHLRKRTFHKLKPLKRKILVKARDMHMQAVLEESKKTDDQQEVSPLVARPDAFLTESIRPSTTEITSQTPVTGDWDKYLLSLLSQDTSHWIASHQADQAYNQEKLKAFLKERHGRVDHRSELIKDNVSEEDLQLGHSEGTGFDLTNRWRRPDETLLDRIRESTLSRGKPTDPYDDDTNAAFYRLPAGFRRAKKEQDKEEDAACNSTAFNIEVKKYEPAPPPTIRDYMNPNVGNTMYETSNTFQQEWLTGGEQWYSKAEASNRIIMNGNKYKKLLQEELPRKPEQWYPLNTKGVDKISNSSSIKQIEKGLHRWNALPVPVDDVRGKILAPQDVDPRALFQETQTSDGCINGHDVMVKGDGDPLSLQNIRTKNNLTRIVHDWRSKWHLDMRYADASPEDLIKDMADIHPHIRLKAITTCARAAEYKPPPEMGISLESQSEKVDYVKLLPENLFIALECCLDDKHERVALAAAIALYTLERPVMKAERLLRKALVEKSNSVDNWAAAQCLAYYGECDSDVVGELVSQLMEGEDPIRHQQAAELLANLSQNSTLVHSMIAEQLNSSSWRHRVMACKVIPKLQGNVNKDLVHKLTHLMWNDWHSEVRKACAQTLGKTGHGKDVHDELLLRITESSEKTRVEAVSKIGHLGIMTAKLLPVFLQCFHDQYVSVRIEACIACSNLKIKDEKILGKLVFVATYDPIWKVKALAIQAMGLAQKETKSMRECILWAFRYEDQEGVRAEACNTIMKLAMDDPEVVQILQDRYLVETSDIVRQKLSDALAMFGVSPTEDMDMVAQIKGEVRKLCTKSNIALQITVNELEHEQHENKERMIYSSTAMDKRNPYQKQRTLSQITQSSLTDKMHPSGQETMQTRPVSQESSMVDKEIQDIFEKAKRGRLTPESLSHYTESRPTTSVSSRSKVTEGTSKPQEEDGIQFSSSSKPKERSCSTHTKDSLIIEDQYNEPPFMGESDHNMGVPKGKSVDMDAPDFDCMPDNETKLSEMQTYVEITGEGNMQDDVSEDVLTMQHKGRKFTEPAFSQDVLK